MSPRKKAQPTAVSPEPGTDAAPEPDPGTATGTDSLVAPDRAVVFFLDGQRYALSTEDVQEIHQIVALKEVPDPAEAVMGMIDLRGNVIPVVDLRLLVGLPFRAYDLQTPMIVCRGHGQLVALIVDEVQDVLELPEGCLQRASRMHALADRLVGVCRLADDLVLLLDIDAVLPERSACAVSKPKRARSTRKGVSA